MAGGNQDLVCKSSLILLSVRGKWAQTNQETHTHTHTAGSKQNQERKPAIGNLTVRRTRRGREKAHE